MEKLGEAATEASRDQARAQAQTLGQQLAASRHGSTAAARQARAAAEQERASRQQAEAAIRAIQAAEATVRRARISVAECEVRAPLSGTWRRWRWSRGELALPGAVLARLVDTRNPKATFYLPNAELAAARPGQSATVRADAYPERTFPARVLTVAHEAEFTPRNVQTRSDRDRLVYPVEVRVEDPEGCCCPACPWNRPGPRGARRRPSAESAAMSAPEPAVDLTLDDVRRGFGPPRPCGACRSPCTAARCTGWWARTARGRRRRFDCWRA